jgi:integrase
MGMLYRRGNTWWAKYCANGRPIYRSTKTSKVTAARRLLKRWEGNPTAYNPQEDRIRVDDLLADLVNDYKVNGKRALGHVKRYKQRLEKWFGGRRAVEITTADVRAYIAARQEAKLSNATINRHLSALKRAFNIAYKDGKLARKPYIPMLAEENVRTGFFSEADYLALREMLPPRLRAPADFACTYGWRKGEVAGLTWDRVDLMAGTVRLDPEHSKNKRGRTIVLTAGLLETLKILRRQTSALEARTGQRIPWVFHHRNGTRIRDFRKAWDTACDKVGLAGRVFHDFRRTAIRNMTRAGIPERVAMTISGHKTRSIFDRYDIVSESDLRDAARKLGGDVTPTIPAPVEGSKAVTA